MTRFLIGVLKLIGLFLLVVVIAAVIPKVGTVVSAVIMLVGLIAVVKPLPQIGLSHRGLLGSNGTFIWTPSAGASSAPKEVASSRSQKHQRVAAVTLPSLVSGGIIQNCQPIRKQIASLE
jgi:hypothetical protein